MPHLLLALALAAPLSSADLSPLLGERAAAGVAAYEAGRNEEAAHALAGCAEPGAAWVRALALLRVGKHRDALQAAEGLEAKLPELADRIAMLRGEALASEGRPDEALAAWASVPDGSPRALEARLAWARVAADRGDAAGALARLAPLLGQRPPADPARPDHAAGALLLAGKLSAAGEDGATARGALVDCWAGHPLAPEAGECRSALAALPGKDGRPPSREETLRRAEGLLDANRNDAATALLRPMLSDLAAASPTDPIACRIRVAAGRALRRERSYERAITTLRPAAASCPDPESRVRALYLLASASSISGDREEAVRLYRRLAREFPTHPFADDALFFAADLLARLGRTGEARETLAALVQAHPNGDYRDEARFRGAWLARRAGELDAAVAQLLAIEEDRRDDPYEHARAAYWRARVLAAGGSERRAAARAIWADLVARYPADYYGLLSRARLEGEKGPVALPVPLAVARAPEGEAGWDPGPLRDDPRLRAGILLLRLGLGHDAAEELGAIDPARLREAAQTAPDVVLLVADLLDRAGDHRAAHGLLRTRARAAFRRPPDAENARAWRIAYPPAYRDAVRRWAPPAGVPVDLVQALMREESALDPRALSPAGAIGLTQLMLPTAQELARQLKLGKVSKGALADASLNIRLGSRYLGELVRRFDGSIPLALAAYNAGGGAVSRWLETRRGLEVDEFVEEIPVEETRGYVKRVLRSYAAYWLLYGETPRVGETARAARPLAGLSDER
jgi:soluble lytic murein transglycosylase